MAKPKDEPEGPKDMHGIPVEQWGDEPVHYTEEERRKLFGEEACMRRDRWIEQKRADMRKRQQGIV